MSFVIKLISSSFAATLNYRITVGRPVLVSVIISVVTFLNYDALVLYSDHNLSVYTNGLKHDILELTYLPWSNDLECNDLTIQFIRNKSYPLIALATFPGSGNTWIRGLIERLTGYFTGLAYSDKALYMKGKPWLLIISYEILSNIFKRNDVW